MSAILHRDLRAALPVAVRGDGAWIELSDGRRVLDACGGAAVSCLGHSDPRPARAVAEQLDRLAFTHSGFFTSDAAEALADRLVARSPAGAGRAMILGSGSEAMEAALKLARQVAIERGEPARDRIVAREGSYHGNTLGALAVGGHAGRRAPYGPMLMKVAHAPACHAYRGRRDGETEADWSDRLLAETEAVIADQGEGRVLALVLEPVGGATLGTPVPPPGHLAGLRAICDRHGLLMIADEVMCGMGRTGTLYALEQDGVAADIVTAAKGLGAGIQPIAAVVAGPKVVDAIEAGSGRLWNGHTYMGHAAACAGALAVLDAIEADGLLARVQVLGARLRAGLEATFGQHPHIGDIRGRGLFQTVEIVDDRATKTPFAAARAFAPEVKRLALEEGLMCYPSQGCADGTNGDHVLLAPPFICTEAEIDEAVSRLARAIDRALA
ncbi:MAG: aspartate aminotransferase family protein [Pseudomonadota bacterium]